MKTALMIAALVLTLASGAKALTVNLADIAGKTNLTVLKEVNLQNTKKKVLADAKGISIYTFDMDSTNTSVCKGSCLRVWPPLEALSTSVVLPPYSTIMGNNGKLQLTLNGLPLYYFQNDKVPSDIFGQYPNWQLVLIKE